MEVEAELGERTEDGKTKNPLTGSGRVGQKEALEIFLADVHDPQCTDAIALPTEAIGLGAKWIHVAGLVHGQHTVNGKESLSISSHLEKSAKTVTALLIRNILIGGGSDAV
jgi:hypothetical protein